MTSAPAAETVAAVQSGIDSAPLLEDLRELVALPSTGGSAAEVEVQHWCAARLAQLGGDVDSWRLDLAALRADRDFPGEEVDRLEAWGCVATFGPPGVPALVLNGHVDVVPPGDPATWSTRDPWTLQLRPDGVAVGRGTCDMKAGVAAVLAAARAVTRAVARGEVRLRRPFAVHTVVGEEDGGLGAFATLQRGHVGEACVIAEPTDGAVVPANSGSLTFRLEVPGRATHGSTRTAGMSALDAALPVLAALRDLERSRNAGPPAEFAHLDLAAPLSVGRVRAGDWPSTVPDALVAEGRYGVLPGETPPQARASLERAVTDACATSPWLREHPVRVAWTGGAFAPGALPPGHPLLERTVDAVAEAAGWRPRVVGAPYGSDLRLYAAAGVPTLQYGPGELRHAHAVDEQVRLDDVLLAARTYALLLLRSCT